MKARRQIRPVFANFFPMPRLLISSSRSRPQTPGNEPAESGISLTNGSSAVEILARTAEAGFVERVGLETVKRAKKLFDQQLWLWGQDIAKLNPNGLIEFGFQRHKPPSGVQTCSCYTLADTDRRQVALWGFGAFYGEAGVGGMFLKRSCFGPSLSSRGTQLPHYWDFKQWSAHRSPANLEDWFLVDRLVDGFIGWIIGYEGWIKEHTPRSYRSECLSLWTKHCSDAEQIGVEWESIRKSLSKGTQNEFRETAA
jgi:hypothetical protein